MPFIDAVPLRHLGPKSDLSVAYLNATINGTTVTVNATETTAGFGVERTGTGAFTVTFKKCRFCQIHTSWLPTVAANNLTPRILAGVDPAAGTATLNLINDSAAAADAAAANNELELMFLLGF